MSECKYPHKQKYPTLRKAKRARQFAPGGRYNYPYRCGDHYHLGRDAWKHIDRALKKGAS